MKSIERELEELRARVARLETELARLAPPVPAARVAENPPPAPRTVVEPPLLAEPPPLPSGPEVPLAGVKPKRSSGWKIEDVPSTVWIAAAGAVIFLLGAIYALTVSIERGWVSPPVRVATGLVFSLAAGVWAARLLFGASRALGITLLAVAAGTWTFSLYFGAKEAHLFAPWLGFVGAAVGTLLAGAIAARVRSDGAMAVALATGLVAPIAFSTGTGTVAALSLYLAGLLGAQLLAHYVTGSGGDWKISRALSLGLLWVVAVSGALEARLGEPVWAVVALFGLLLLALLLTWLPRHPQSPTTPAAWSVVGLAAATLALWHVWSRNYEWWREGFALVLVAMAALALALVIVGRHRVGSRQHDLPLMLAGAGFALLAVPVALNWRWLSVVWGVAAVLATYAAWRAVREERPEARALRIVARVATSLATGAWFFALIFQTSGDWLFLNRVFVGGMLAAAAWAMALRLAERRRTVPFVMLQLVAVNAFAWELARVAPSYAEDGVFIPLGALLATLVFTVAGAAQWLRGVLYEQDDGRAKALRLAGYGWLSVAAGKLLLRDLGETDLVYRAIAALGVGAIFIGAALWADRHRVKRQHHSA